MDIQRRKLIQALAAAGAAGFAPAISRGEPPPETTRLRLNKGPSACLAPQYVAAARCGCSTSAIASTRMRCCAT